MQAVILTSGIVAGKLQQTAGVSHGQENLVQLLLATQDPLKITPLDLVRAFGIITSHAMVYAKNRNSFPAVLF